MSKLILNEQASAPSTPSAGKVALWQNTVNPSQTIATNDDGNSYIVGGVTTGSTAAVSAGYATDTYLAGSGFTIGTAGAWKAGTVYLCLFDMVKTAAGTAAFTVNVRLGTAGTTADPSVLQLAFAVGTAAIDTGHFELLVNFRSVGAGTSAVVAGMIKCNHHLAATGLITTGASGTGIILGTGAGFNSTTQTKIGISVNGGASFSGTNTIVQSNLMNI